MKVSFFCPQVYYKYKYKKKEYRITYNTQLNK